MCWTVRLKFRISKPLHSELNEVPIAIGDREGTIVGENGKALASSSWLTLEISNFESENTARSFGNSAVRALLLAGAREDIGVDVGEDRAAISWGRGAVDAIAEQGGKLMQNIHGLQVYKRGGNERFVELSATATISISIAPFIDAVGVAFGDITGIGETEQSALMLLALSKSAREPLAEAALCISAVELLAATDAPWTGAQRDLLVKMQAQASTSDALSDGEAHEVAEAIGRLFRTSVRQSIKKRMMALGFTSADWQVFDEEVYALRSGIFHGSTTGRAAHVELASIARGICARIVLAAAQQ